MGFCVLGGKENVLRRALSQTLTSLGEAVGIGASVTAFTSAIQSIYTDRYTAGQDSLKVSRKLTLNSSQTGPNENINDNWYTTCDASAVYNAGVTATKKGTAVALDVRHTKTFTNSSASNIQGTMIDLTSEHFGGFISSGTLTVQSNSAGYLPASTNVYTLASGSTSKITLSNVRTNEMQYAVTPNLYNTFVVDQTGIYDFAYNQGQTDLVNGSSVFASGTIGAGQSKSISYSKPAWVIVQGVSYNSRGIFKREGTSITTVVAVSTTCTATASAITITNNNSGSYDANYWVISF